MTFLRDETTGAHVGSSSRPGLRFVAVLDIVIYDAPEVLDWIQVSGRVSVSSVNEFIIADLLMHPTNRRPHPGPTGPVYGLTLGVRILCTRSTKQCEGPSD